MVRVLLKYDFIGPLDLDLFLIKFFNMKTNPQNLKFKKYHKPSIHLNKNNVNFKLRFGSLALQTNSNGALTFSQIESGRKALRRVLRKTGFL